MADATLSEAQIDALFAAAGAGALPQSAQSGRPRTHGRVTTVDFSRPSKFTKEQERQLRRAHETFCRTASTRLSADLRTQIELDVIGVSQLTWANALLAIPPESVCAVLDVQPLGKKLLLTLERTFLLTLIERLCGGSLTAVAADRPFTDIDEVIGHRIIRLFVDQLSLVWNELADVGLDFEEVDQEPGSARIAVLSEPTLSVSIEVRLSKRSYVLSVMLPYSSIEQAAGKFALADLHLTGGDPAQLQAMRAAVATAAVELRAEVAAIEMSAEEVLALREGDVVRLGPAAQGIRLCAAETPLYVARPGRDGTRRAVQVASGVPE